MFDDWMIDKIDFKQKYAYFKILVTVIFNGNFDSRKVILTNEMGIYVFLGGNWTPHKVANLIASFGSALIIAARPFLLHPIKI